MRPLLTRNRLHLLGGPMLFLIILLLFQPPGLSIEARAVLATTAWVAYWWITEVIPIPVTSLLPIVLLPLSGALSVRVTTAAYGDETIFLFLGGFLLAIAMEKWNLHRRVALLIIAGIGTDARQIVLGFMVATAFISMWISNTAATMMMLPIALALISEMTSFDLATADSSGSKVKSNFGRALMLGIAYAASIGGLGTLVGTPTNAIFAAVVRQIYQTDVSFANWMLFGVPIAGTLTMVCWWFLAYVVFPPQLTAGAGRRAQIRQQLLDLGPMTAEENRVLLIFGATAFAWITRGFLLQPFLPGISDAIIAIGGGVALFMVPARRTPSPLLTWDVAPQLPWGLLLLFGGGLALAAGFRTTGLADWIGTQLTVISDVPFWLILLLVILLVNLLSEVTSNVATATMILPILASFAAAVDVHPYGLMVGASAAASCAFMLPVATPPNAIVFGSGYIEMKDMIRAGFWLSMISVVICAIFVYVLMPLVWGIDLQQFPAELKNVSPEVVK